jgi:hypothetical protein
MKPVSFRILLAVALLGSVAALAQSGGQYFITHAITSGGGATFSSSGRFQLGSTIAQPVASAPSSSRFAIQGGFWIYPAPAVLAPGIVGTNFVFSFQAELGKTYTPQYSDSLAAPSWQSLPNIAGDGTVKSVTNSAPGVAQRYYRLLER